MSHDNATDYGPCVKDVSGRFMQVETAACGCCGSKVRTNTWSLFGNGNVRCNGCRAAGCNISSRKPRCGRPGAGTLKVVFGVVEKEGP